MNSIMRHAIVLAFAALTLPGAGLAEVQRLAQLGLEPDECDDFLTRCTMLWEGHRACLGECAEKAAACPTLTF